MTKLIIFDWDDVFTIGSTRGYYACYHQTLLEVGVHLDPNVEESRIKARWGTTHEIELAELLQESPELIERACLIYEKHLFGDTFLNALTTLPGIQDFINNLAKKYKLAIASGIHPKLLKEYIFPRFKIPNAFSKIVTSYDLKDMNESKPNPLMVNMILNDLNIKPEDAVLVGDAKNDVMMAKNAGIKPIVVLSGHLDRREAINLGVTSIIADVTKLNDVL
ncbi:MAG: HAD family phosphatase [Acidimicrobiia bacterium]|nr:HAD family phosphatase [Acidimicrobiia bacterium]